MVKARCWVFIVNFFQLFHIFQIIYNVEKKSELGVQGKTAGSSGDYGELRATCDCRFSTARSSHF
jgi:hypothetical protein